MAEVTSVSLHVCVYVCAYSFDSYQQSLGCHLSLFTCKYAVFIGLGGGGGSILVETVIYICIHTNKNIWRLYIYNQTYIYIYICVCTCMFIYECIYMHFDVYIFIYIHMYVYIYVYVLMYFVVFEKNYVLYSFTPPRTMCEIFPIVIRSSSLLILCNVQRWLFHIIAHAAEQYWITKEPVVEQIDFKKRPLP